MLHLLNALVLLIKLNGKLRWLTIVLFFLIRTCTGLHHIRVKNGLATYRTSVLRRIVFGTMMTQCSARLIFITTCFIQFIITGGEINQIDRYCFDISKRKQPFTEIEIICNNFNIFVWFNRLSVLVTQMMNDRFQFHSFLRFINQKLDGAKNISRACFTMLWFCVPWMKLMSPSCGCLWVNVSATSAFIGSCLSCWQGSNQYPFNAGQVNHLFSPNFLCGIIHVTWRSFKHLLFSWCHWCHQ